MQITWVDANGFLSFFLNLLGNLLLAWKWKSGWWVRIVANLSWGIYGVQIASLPMLANAAAFFLVNCYGYWKWRREEKVTFVVREPTEKEKLDAWFEEQRRSA